MDWMPQAVREGILTILFISGPLVLLAAGLGLTIGIIQAATQVQEQTLGSAVKIIGLFIALIVGGFFMFQYLKKYATENIERAFRLVPSLGEYVKPRRNFMSVPYKEDGDKGKNAITAPPPAEKGSSAGKLADEIAEPDLELTNVDEKVDQLQKPPSQVKTENKNIKKQDLVKVETKPQAVKPEPNSEPKPEPQAVPVAKPALEPKPEPAPVKPVVQAPVTQPAVAPAPVNLAPPPTPKPKPRTRGRNSSRLDRLRGELQGAQ